MTPAARIAAAIELLDEIEAQSRPADQVASFYFKNRRFIGSKDRRAVAETVWRVLRRKARIDWWLERLDFPKDGRARVFADMSLDKIKPTPEMFQGAHSTPHPGAEEKRMMERLREVDLFHRDQPQWVRGEFPEWITERFIALWGEEELGKQVGAMRDEAPLDLRVNTLKATREEAIIALKKEGISATPCTISPVGLRLQSRVALVQLDAWRNGLIEVQDEGSQLVGLITDARPGQKVVDYCAGAGGKTLALAAKMQNKGRLIACDVAEWRVDKAQDRFRRNGVHCVTRKVISGESDKWIKRQAKSCDRVLVDAPCTGTGTWRRNPDAKWNLKESDLLELVVRQASILKSASRMVKPGGKLVYATCSIMREENELQVENFLAQNPDFELVPVVDIWDELIGTPCPVTGPWLRLTPLEHGTDGFFAAVMTRKGTLTDGPADEIEAEADSSGGE